MIAILRLTDGTEVIGTMEHSSNEYVIIHRPLKLNYRYFVNTTPSLWFTKYILFADGDSISFAQNQIVNQVTARPVFARFYLEHVAFHYEELAKELDAELEAATESSKPSTEKMKEFLEALSVEGAPVN